MRFQMLMRFTKQWARLGSWTVARPVVSVVARPLGAAALACVWAVGVSATTLTFDDLPTLPAVNTATGLFFANNNSASYGGVVFDSRTTVFGDQYRVDTGTPGPLFGLPRSGHYGLTNTGSAGNDGIVLTTTQVLTSAWFCRNEYYGFGAGADQITIFALSGITELGAVVFDLPAGPVLGGVGQPAPLTEVDTSVFLTLSGITGYRIDRRELGQQTGNWVADDFSFVAPNTVPEPPVGLLVLVAGWAGLGLAKRRVGRSGRRGRQVVP